MSGHPPAAQELLEKARIARIDGKLAGARDAFRRGATVTALDLLDEAQALMKEQLEAEGHGNDGDEETGRA